MDTFFDRLVKERDELRERSTKLVDFLRSDNSNNIGQTQISLLRTQYKIMEAYLEVLDTRIQLLV